MSNSTFWMLICLFVCHWLADYTPLSTRSMLKAKATGEPWFPIMLHGATHGTLMSLVVLLFTQDIMLGVFACTFQGLTHWGIDTLKGRCNVYFPAVKDTTKYFHWIVFGLDQLLHAVVILFIVKFITHAD